MPWTGEILSGVGDGASQIKGHFWQGMALSSQGMALFPQEMVLFFPPRNGPFFSPEEWPFFPRNGPFFHGMALFSHGMAHFFHGMAMKRSPLRVEFFDPDFDPEFPNLWVQVLYQSCPKLWAWTILGLDILDNIQAIRVERRWQSRVSWQ